MKLSLAAASAAVALLAAVALASAGANWWMSPAFYVAVALGLIFVMSPLADILSGDTDYQFGIPIGSSYPKALTLAAIGTTFMATSFGLSGAKVSSRHPRPERDVEANVRRRLPSVTLVILGLTSIFLVHSGGLKSFFAGRTSTTNAAFQANSGYLYAAPLWLFPLGLYLYVRACQEHSSRRLGIVVMSTSQLFTLLLGDRSYFLPAGLALCIGHMIGRGSKPRKLLLIALIPVVLYGGVIVPRILRDGSSGTRPTLSQALSAAADSVTQGPWYSVVQGNDFAMARNFALALQVVPSRTGYALGSTYASAVLRPVPRQLFGAAGKPVDADTALNKAAIYSQVSITAGFSYSFFSEPYYNFGTFGIILFGLVFGFAMKRIQGKAIHGSLTASQTVYYAATVALMVVLVRGNLGTEVQRIGFFTLPLYLVAKTVPRRTVQRRFGTAL